jgi:hypothetical protein
MCSKVSVLVDLDYVLYQRYVCRVNEAATATAFVVVVCRAIPPEETQAEIDGLYIGNRSKSAQRGLSRKNLKGYAECKTPCPNAP